MAGSSVHSRAACSVLSANLADSLLEAAVAGGGMPPGLAGLPGMQGMLGKGAPGARKPKMDPQKRKALRKAQKKARKKSRR